MVKGTSRGFRKCGSFENLEVLNYSYRLLKYGQNEKKKIDGEGAVKKKTLFNG